MPESTSKTIKVVVVGGGIAGLSTAYLLERKARQQGVAIDLTLLEALTEPGGATRTDIIDDYLCEWGPNGFLDNEPTTLELVKFLGLDGDLVRAGEASSKRYIYHNGKMRSVPLSPPMFLKSNIVSLPAKFRMMMEFFVPGSKHEGDETVKSFGERRLGKEFVRYLLDPMVSGIFAGDISRLSLKAVFPKMVEMERDYGGLFRAMFAKQREAKKAGKKSGGPAGPGAVLHTFEGGMGKLTSELSRLLNDKIRLEVPVKSVQRTGTDFTVLADGMSISADIVVLAVPSHSTSKIIQALAPDVARTIAEIQYAPVDVFCYGYQSSQLTYPLNGFGVLIPRSERIRSLGTLWSDQIFPGQAPTGNRLMRTIMGGAHDYGIGDVSVEELRGIAIKDNSRVMGLRGEPLFEKVYRHSKGIAQYNVGHVSRVAELDRLERELPGIFFTGAAYRGVSVNGSVKDAFRVADQALSLR